MDITKMLYKVQPFLQHMRDCLYYDKLQAGLTITTLTLFQFLTTSNIIAQQIRFDHLSTDNGLSQDIVNSIIQDSQGFMWFGTEDGLNRYDGYSVHVYKNNSSDTNSISGDWITDLCTDRHGRLLIGTNSGLNLFDSHSERFTKIKHKHHSPISTNPQWIASVCKDSMGNVWVLAGGKIHRLDESSNILIEPPNTVDLSSKNIQLNRLLVDRDGILWATTTNGLFKVDTSAQTIITSNRNTSDLVTRINGSIREFVEDQQHNLWIVTVDSGLIRIDADNKKIIQYRQRIDNSQSLSSNTVLSTCIDTRGRFWVGTFTALDLYDPNTDGFIHYFPNSNEPSSLLGSRVYKIYNDRTGTLWIGTYRGGVNRFDPLKQRFLHYRHKVGTRESLSNNEVYAFAEDRNNRLYVGTSAGVDLFDRVSQKFKHLVDAEKQLGSAPVMALCSRDNGSLWIGTELGSLYLVDSMGRILRTFFKWSDVQSRLGQRAIKALHETREGKLWIGTSQSGLICLDTKDWHVDWQPLAGSGLDFGYGVWVIYQDQNNFLWFGGWGGSANLVKYDLGKGTGLQYKTYPTGCASIRAIYEDSAGIFWLGTWGGGLKRYDPSTDRVTEISEQDGLSNNFVKGILADDNRRLWISTERGITRYDTHTGACKRFTKEDGLQGDRYFSGSLCRTKDGWMFFGGENGFNAFHPDSIKDNSYIPPVVVTNFRVLDRSVVPGETVNGIPSVHMDYNQDYFSFEFVALNYTQVQNNQYAYMMEGYDRDWIQCGMRRYAAYTHLDGGTYTFRVKASNNDGVWNEVGTSFLVIIDPPFWKTWWFTVLILVFILGILYTVYRYRINQFLAIERLRARIASDLHDDVGTDLSSIVLATQVIEHKRSLPQEEKEEIRQIGRIALRTQDMMRDIVWVLNSRNDSLNDIVLKMREITGRFLKEISYTFKGPESPLHEKINLEFKRNIFLFYKECLNNIIKHSAATNVNIEIQFRNGEFTLEIRDNGIGFDMHTSMAGVGLQNLRSRAEQVGGSLEISSGKGIGTKILLIVKTP